LFAGEHNGSLGKVRGEVRGILQIMGQSKVTWAGCQMLAALCPDFSCLTLKIMGGKAIDVV
jgi:hypothetical protein